MSLSIVYIGNYRHSFCTEVHLARELESLGHRVERMQETPGGCDVEFLNGVWLKAREADLLLYTRTWGVPEQATGLWRALESEGCATASYHLDLYRGLQREGGIERDPFWTTQWVFTPDGNADTAEWFAVRGIRHVWTPPAVVSDECASAMPGRVTPGLCYDVVFVGSRRYHREWPWRRRLLGWLARTYGERFRRFGGDTDPGPMRGQDLNDLYASAKVVVGDSCFAAPAQRYTSDRPFETFGRGGFLIYPRLDFLVEMLGPYPSYAPFDYELLRCEIDAALADPQGRAETVARLSAEIAQHHTYRHRLAAALETMGLA